MSLPMLFAGGADCGPSNPLHGLSKRFDQDRGVQQDQFGVARAGSSREAFRTQTGPAGPDADAVRFFSSSTPTMSAPALSTAFDVSAMQTALPSIQTPQRQASTPVPVAVSGWAADFMNMNTDLGAVKQQQGQGQIASTAGPGQMTPVVADANVAAMHSPQPLMQNWNPMGLGMLGFMPRIPMQQQQQQQASASRFSDQISWDKEFSAQEIRLASSIPEQTTVETQQQELHRPQFDGDELARTAGQLIENLKHETNPKFQNSQFLGLMRQLRDGEVVVDGNKVVENDRQMRNSAQINSTDIKGKGKERAHAPMDPSSSLDSWKHAMASGFLPTMGSPVLQEQQNSGQQHEDENDAYFRQENADYTKYWQEFSERMAPSSNIPYTSQEREWDTLQEDWDRFEATSSGIRELSNYRFQENNPYLLGDSSRTRHHTMHNGMSSVLESVLELEAAVQRDMTNAKAWFELGVKQQENEREHKALQALQRTVELDPTHLPSWLALAVSYTNDNNRQGTYDAVEEWVKRNERYTSIKLDAAPSAELSMTERYARLVDQLIAMARSDMSGEIDADIQIALAVLLNTNEDYEKAQDCFRTALAVRPDDWLLYNRVGATMANSGHAGEALHYYYRALELNPGYIRARFNLGISCINLRRYDEAAQHILDALVLQDSDGTRDPTGGRGVTSSALWDSLKTACLQMQRLDLASLCDSRDLERFGAEFRTRFQEQNE